MRSKTPVPGSHRASPARAHLCRTEFIGIAALRCICTLFTAALISACATSSGTGEGNGTAPIQRVPVEDLNTSLDTPDDDQTEEHIEQRQHSATAKLLALAQDAATSNNHSDAIVMLERAIRITPRNSELWTALAQVHAAKGAYEIAIQHVRKAIALAGTDSLLERDAWLALADIKQAQGDANEADSIRRRYARVRG